MRVGEGSGSKGVEERTGDAIHTKKGGREKGREGRRGTPFIKRREGGKKGGRKRGEVSKRRKIEKKG